VANDVQRIELNTANTMDVLKHAVFARQLIWRPQALMGEDTATGLLFGDCLFGDCLFGDCLFGDCLF